MGKDLEAMYYLGFSKQTINCYATLDTFSLVIASELAQAMGKTRTQVYELLKPLEEKGFVKRSDEDEGPAYFYSIPVEDALDEFFQWQRQKVLQIIQRQRRDRQPR
ncbi:MAG: helix-turn-helix domain-containing protein [Candidatus Saccharimonadales bacterium]